MRMLGVLSFSHLYLDAQIHGYLFIFLIMLVNGPLMTLAGAFASYLGYLNIWMILLISFFADLVGDIFFFIIGRMGKKKILKKKASLWIKGKTLDYLERNFDKHFGKTLFFVKLTPLVVPGLIACGASKISTKRYIKWNIITIIPKTIFFAGIGYFFGFFAKDVLRIYNNIQFDILVLVVVIIVVYVLTKIFSDKALKSQKIIKHAKRKTKKILSFFF